MTDIEMAEQTESLLFHYRRYNKPTYRISNNANICRLIYLSVFHLSFIIGDVYFIINDCHHTPKIIIDTKVYFAIDILIESIWVIFIIILTFLKKNINLSSKFQSQIIVNYYGLVCYWNIIGIFLLLDLSNYSCGNDIHNYLFVKIIMTSLNLLSLLLALIVIFYFMDLILYSDMGIYLIRYLEFFT